MKPMDEMVKLFIVMGVVLVLTIGHLAQREMTRQFVAQVNVTQK